MPAAAPSCFTCADQGRLRSPGQEKSWEAQGCQAHLWSLCRSVLLYTDSSSSCQAAPATGGVAGP